MVCRIIALTLLSFSSVVAAQDAGQVLRPPRAEIIKQVLDYQENGKALGPALLDLIPCTKVDSTKGSPTQFQCLEVVKGPVPKGTTVFAWLQWLCPKEGRYDDVQIQYLHEGQVRKTIDFPVVGFGRTRGWRGDILSKVGRWTITVSRAGQELGSVSVDVTAP